MKKKFCKKKTHDPKPFTAIACLFHVHVHKLSLVLHSNCAIASFDLSKLCTYAAKRKQNQVKNRNDCITFACAKCIASFVMH